MSDFEPLGFRDEIPSYPDRIIVMAGAGFLNGMACGLFSHPLKAIYNFHKNGFNGFKGYPKATLINIPRLGGKFAAFYSTWIALECTMDHFHGDEFTFYHNVIGFPAAIALFKSRQGFRVASRSAIGWGSLFASFSVLYSTIYGMTEEGSFRYDGYVVEIPPLSSDNVEVPPPPPHKLDVVPVSPLNKDSLFEDSWISIMNHQERLENFGGRMLFGGLADWWTSTNKEALEEDDEDAN